MNKVYKSIMLPKNLQEKIKAKAVRKKMTIIQYMYELLRIEKANK